jgi:hypothetical protein
VAELADDLRVLDQAHDAVRTVYLGADVHYVSDADYADAFDAAALAVLDDRDPIAAVERYFDTLTS